MSTYQKHHRNTITPPHRRPAEDQHPELQDTRSTHQLKPCNFDQ
jgi:hypothetical protein